MSRLIKFVILFAAVALCGSGAFAQTVKINELMARNANGIKDEFGDDDDWVEIYNPGASPVNLAGLYISDTNASTNFYRIPGSDATKTTVPAGGYLILWADGEPAEGPNHLNFKLTNGGEGVYLGQLSGGSISLIDQVVFPKLERDVSYGRLPNGTGSFKRLSDPSPGAANLPIRVVGNIQMNELMAVNTGTDRDELNEAEDWIEFYNPTSQAIDLGGVYLTDSVGELTMHRIPISSPDSTTVPPGGFLRFWADAEPTASILHIDFKLSGNGEKITLVQPDGLTIMQQVSYPAQSADATYGQYPDGSGKWVYLNIPTPKTANRHTFTPISGIFINEIMAVNESTFPDNMGEIEDWVEFYNSNNFAVNVGGLLVTDSLQNPMAFRIPNTFPDSTTIPAKGFMVFWADNDPEQGVRHLDIKLSGAGEYLGLNQLRETTQVIDSYSFGFQSPNVSIGRSPDGSSNWTSFIQSTPGNPNTGGGSGKITGLYLNELVARNTTGYQDEYGNIDDWIELYNSTNDAINIAGLFFTDLLSDPSKAQIPQTDLSKTVVPPKGYLVIWPDAKPNLGPLHVNFQLAGSGEFVGIFQNYNGSLVVIDSISYPSQSSNTSYGRAPDGASDWNYFSNPTPMAPNPASGVEDLRNPSGMEVLVYPNPMDQELYVRLVSQNGGLVEWQILDIEGRTIEAGQENCLAGSNLISLNSRSWRGVSTAGVYFLRIQTAGGIVVRKIHKI